jgi:hypothetical protein
LPNGATNVLEINIDPAIRDYRALNIGCPYASTITGPLALAWHIKIIFFALSSALKA